MGLFRLHKALIHYITTAHTYFNFNKQEVNRTLPHKDELDTLPSTILLKYYYQKRHPTTYTEKTLSEQRQQICEKALREGKKKVPFATDGVVQAH